MKFLTLDSRNKNSLTSFNLPKLIVKKSWLGKYTVVANCTENQNKKKVERPIQN